MTDAKKTSPEELHPVSVTIIGTKQDDIPAPGTIAETPKETQPNLIVNVVTPVMALVIRFVNVFLPVFAGLLTGALGTGLIPASDFMDLVQKCAGLSLSGAGVAFLKDLVTIFGKLERKYPLLTGSI